jgi:plastocyanin
VLTVFALAIALVFALVPSSFGATATGAAHPHKAKKKTVKCKTKKQKKTKKCKALAKKKKAKKKKAKAVVAPAAAAAAPACTQVSSATKTLLDGLFAHIQSAHLETSPFQQVAEALQVDDYAKLHTIWIESMTAGLGDKLNQSLDAFLAHVVSAHLELSPGEQVSDALDVDDYAKLHTIWLEGVVKPLLMGSETCSTTTTPSPTPSAPTTSGTAVDIKGNAYVPPSLTVPLGSTVTWTNSDEAPHTVTSAAGGSELKSPTLQKGGKFSHMFHSAGTFSYYCAVHPDMKGTVTVQ